MYTQPIVTTFIEFCISSTDCKRKFDRITEKAYSLVTVDEFIPGLKCDIEVNVF